MVKKCPVILGSEGSYCAHKFQRLDPILNQTIPVRTPSTYLIINIYFNVNLLATDTAVTSALRLSKLGKYMRNKAAELAHERQAFKVDFSPRVSLLISSLTPATRNTYPTCLILFYLFILIILDEGTIYQVFAELEVLRAVFLGF